MHSILRANLTLLLLFMSPIAVGGELAFEGAPGGASAFGAIIGDHKCVMTYRGQDGELSEQADCRWHFYYKFEGHMVQDDFTMYDDAGKAIWNGSTLRTWDLAEERWNNMFLGVHGTGFGKIFFGKHVGGEIHLEVTGTGPDDRDYQDRIYFYDMGDGHFRWRQERSFDQGQTWDVWVKVETV